MSGTEKRFWLFFIFLNFIHFLPAYLLDINTSTFFPVQSFTHGKWFEIFNSLFKRNNYDIFRLSIDLLLLSTLFYFFRSKISLKKYSLFASAYFLILLLFLVYYHAMFNLFLVEPVLYNDIQLIKLGYKNLGEYSFIAVTGILLAVTTLYYMLYVLFSKLFSQLKLVSFGRVSRIIIIVIGFFLFMNIARFGLTINARNVFQLGIGKVTSNFQSSVESAKSLSKLDVPELNRISNTYKSYPINKKPDIYLLFIESYGKIVYDDERFQNLYATINKKCEKQLVDHGWHVASNFSVSPISGGNSWISFSSVMFGINFKNHSTYSFFLQNPEFNNYLNILKYFQTQGYKSYWINSLRNNKKMGIPWKLYTDFYGVDQWIKYEDLDYQGQLYGFGPALPDQYSLFKGQQIINKDKRKPSIVFYITQNSHNPFFSPDSLAVNWETLNTRSNNSESNSVFIKKPVAADYVKSINYELQTLTNFIVQSNNKNAIYILVGDHQPPILTNRKSGFETPVHIISSDSILVADFYKYGFTKGLYIGNTAKRIRHESIYSLLLREIIREYGISKNQLPEYSPYGLTTN